ncbi:MADS-box transcription factor PHERES 1-like [Benincasa hispida]|uniref:MADS-box transcription factor PHERES 1-like n=1 Tax=Benincasa hispida TaxID=102211 RepID=UPI0019003CC1|nr:MADS-box transcription factor PHERES 1-like [Benincasa hispida]
MTRKKVKLVWIASDNARKASFKKRRLRLLKKVSELTTLCGVFVFAVVNGPDEDHPVIWPYLSAAQHLYRRFLSLSEVERQKKIMNQETYLKERTTKAQVMLKKLIKKNQELELDLLMHQLHQGRHISQLTNEELLALFWMVGKWIRDCRKRIEYHQEVHRPPPPPPEFVPFNSPLLEIGSNEMDLVDNGRNLMDQWFIDMVMNSIDKIGGSSSSMVEELGFVQSEVNMGDLMNGGNSMVEIGELGGTETIIVEGDGDENILLSEWNFGVNDNFGMSEIEKLVNDINAVGVEATVSPIDFTHQVGFGIGGDVNDGDPTGILYFDGCYYLLPCP